MMDEPGTIRGRLAAIVPHAVDSAPDVADTMRHGQLLRQAIAQGTVLRGTVIRLGAHQHITIATRAGSITIRSDIRLKRGDHLAFQIEERGGETFLRIISVGGLSLKKYLAQTGQQDEAPVPHQSGRAGAAPENGPPPFGPVLEPEAPAAHGLSGPVVMATLATPPAMPREAPSGQPIPALPASLAGAQAGEVLVLHLLGVYLPHPHDEGMMALPAQLLPAPLDATAPSPPPTLHLAGSAMATQPEPLTPLALQQDRATQALLFTTTVQENREGWWLRLRAPFGELTLQLRSELPPGSQLQWLLSEASLSTHEPAAPTNPEPQQSAALLDSLRESAHLLPGSELEPPPPLLPNPGTAFAPSLVLLLKGLHQGRLRDWLGESMLVKLAAERQEPVFPPDLHAAFAALAQTFEQHDGTTWQYGCLPITPPDPSGALALCHLYVREAPNPPPDEATPANTPPREAEAAPLHVILTGTLPNLGTFELEGWITSPPAPSHGAYQGYGVELALRAAQPWPEALTDRLQQLYATIQAYAGWRGTLRIHAPCTHFVMPATHAGAAVAPSQHQDIRV